MRKLGWAQAALIGIAGNAPTYSIAVSSAALVTAAGTGAPLVVLVCGLITLGILFAYARLNAAQPNAGAAYAWVGSMLHPAAGFFAGWCVMMSSVIFMISAALPAGKATLLVVAPAYADDKAIVIALAAFWLIVVTAIVSRGTELLGRVQSGMTVFELGLILAIAAGVVAQVSAADFAALAQMHSAQRWSAASLANGLVVAIFIFWGWDVIFNLAEETAATERASSRAAFVALAVLIALFVFFAAVVLTMLTASELDAGGGNVIFALADKFLPKPLGYAAVLMFLLSVIGGMEASIVSFSRTALANARDRRLPALLGRLDEKSGAPAAAAICGGAIILGLLLVSAAFETVETAITASINITGIIVAAYYGMAAIACAVFFRRNESLTPRGIALYVVWPLAAALIFFAAAVITLIELDALALGILAGALALGGLVVVVRRTSFSRSRMQSSGSEG